MCVKYCLDGQMAIYSTIESTASTTKWLCRSCSRYQCAYCEMSYLGSSPKEQCYKCQKGYMLAMGICEPEPICEEGTYLEYISGMPVCSNKTIEGCDQTEITEDGLVCKTAKTGYTLTSNQVEITKQTCSSPKYLNYNENTKAYDCKDCPAECQACTYFNSTHASCQSCKPTHTYQLDSRTSFGSCAVVACGISNCE